METNASKRPMVPRFTGGLILGFGLVIVAAFVAFHTDRRASPAVPTAVRPAAPAIRLTSPGSGAQFQAPADIPLEAAVEHPSSPVLVEFFHGPIKIGEASAPPYRCTWKGLRFPGHYQLTAKLGEIESPTVWVWVDREPTDDWVRR
jgi:hypothetical protein